MAGTKEGAEKRRVLSSSPTFAASIRARINAPLIVKALQDHVDGSREMAATQVQAAHILLRKCVPDLSENKTELETGTNLTNILRGLRR